MSTQYDRIGASFNNLTKLPGSRLGYFCLQEAVEPLLKNNSGIKALDLACGTGRYTRALRSWGAASVLGVDISTRMIDAARASASASTSASTSSSPSFSSPDVDEKVKFIVGDCSNPALRYSEGPFDLILGAWLLNYASCGAEMADMYRHVWINLKTGGTFVAMVPPATEDPAGQIAEAAQVRRKVRGETHMINLGPVEDGVRQRLWGGTEPEVIEFDGYHLRKSVYERAAREGGFAGELNWTECRIPQLARESREVTEAWSTYEVVPHASILVVRKE